MSFMSFCDEEMVIKLPRPNKGIVSLNLKKYKEILSKSIINNDKKQLIKRLTNLNGDFPIFCEENKRFFMCNFTNKKLKAREVKSREDKSACGVLLNALLISETINNINEINVNWEVPSYVINIKKKI